jgi:hypothetical protein
MHCGYTIHSFLYSLLFTGLIVVYSCGKIHEKDKRNNEGRRRRYMFEPQDRYLTISSTDQAICDLAFLNAYSSKIS